MKTIADLMREHGFFADFEPAAVDLIAGCGRNVVFKPGDYLFREGQAAEHFYFIRDGSVALEMAAPGRPTMTLLTIGTGEVVGLSWLVPPHLWRYDARATTSVRAIAFTAACLRGKCEADPALGYALMKRFMTPLLERLHSARLQSMDVYLGPKASAGV